MGSSIFPDIFQSVTVSTYTKLYDAPCLMPSASAPYAILRALGRAVWRDLHTFRTIAGNNFALFVGLLMMQPQSAQFFVLLFALLLLGPLSSDPLQRVPATRFALWPLSDRQRLTVRAISPFLSPMAWMAFPILWRSVGLQVALLAVAFGLVLQVAAAVWKLITAKRPRTNPFQFGPRLPGRLGALVQKDLRQMLSMLDPWLALLLSITGVCARILVRNLDPEAPAILALIVTAALSTYAQALFGLDGSTGRQRLHLFPLKGWRILAAKDLTYLVVVAVLTAPLALLPGLAGGLIVLAVGHWASIQKPLQQARWRFTGGEILPMGLYQMIPMFTVGVAVARSSLWYLALAAAFYAASLWWCGRLWDRS